MKFGTGLLFIALFNFSQTASAHLKWFATDDQKIDLGEYYASYHYEIIIGSVLCCLMIALAIWLDKKFTFEMPPTDVVKKSVIRAFSILIGLSLLYASYSQSILAAHYLVSNRILVVLQYLQAVVGFMLIFNLFPKVAASILIFIYVVLATQFGLLEVLDYINFIGIALFLILLNSKNESQRDLCVPVIRVVTGATLIILAFSEKFLHPNLGLRFLEEHNWNFMPAIGAINFTNELFVLSVGLVELLIGVLFVLGVLTRVNTLVLLAFMVMSNITFLVQSSNNEAMTELAGHLPIVAIALILLMSGAGPKWKVV